MPATRTLPTAARLVAAISLGALGWTASEMIRPLMPEHTAFGWFNYVNVCLGLLCGWTVVGARAGRGWADALASGLTGCLALVLLGLLVQSVNLMLKQSMEGRFAGPLEAVTGIFGNATNYGTYLIDPSLVTVLLLGGMGCGLLAEMALRRWD